ncbi:MAG: co-chaperone DjlA [Chromatiales bacterium]|nr:MAG: co-chaperone DjlA [Chromatiales bacterium]
MKWIGKAVGAVLGLATGLGPVGAAIGLVIGHAYDERMESDDGARHGADLATVRSTFFRNSFKVMGFVAKADGRVSEREIAAAREIFRQFRLDEVQRREAIDCFTAGKAPGFSLDVALDELVHVCGGRRDLLRMFLEVEMRAALLGNGMQGPTRSLLMRICQRLGVSGLEFAHLEALLRLQGYGAAYAGTGPGAGGHWQGEARTPPRAEPLSEAYEVLEVPDSATDAEVKRAYRRQMSQNHPDKLVSRGLPESMLEIAKQKTQTIQAAYEKIRVARGMR